jgi:hypothetical protein
MQTRNVIVNSRYPTMPNTVEEEYVCFRKPLLPELKVTKEKSKETGI